jgi:hypothetical protein
MTAAPGGGDGGGCALARTPREEHGGARLAVGALALGLALARRRRATS